MSDDFVKISMIEFIEDPHDDCAFAIRFEAAGPGKRFLAVRVSFSELFMKDYFKIPWNKDIVVEEHKIVKARRNDFLIWALVKMENMLEKGPEKTTIEIDSPDDLIWAQKVMGKKIVSKSQKIDDRTFSLKIR